MNIDDLTIKQARELASIFSPAQNRSMYEDLIDQYVIVRSRNEGINAGYVERCDETGIVLREARRIWYHRPKDKSLSWYEGVARSGVSDSSKLSGPTTKVIVEDYSITVCSAEAEISITGAPIHEQS